VVLMELQIWDAMLCSGQAVWMLWRIICRSPSVPISPRRSGIMCGNYLPNNTVSHPRRLESS